jgi:serine/threonine-protein kinase RsbW
METRFERRVTAHQEHIAILRGAVVGHAKRWGASPEVCDDVRLAVSEALTNVVQHAYLGIDAGSMTVEAWVDDDDALVVWVVDDGHGLRPRIDSPGLGLGLGLMALMSDDFRIATRDGGSGTAVSLRFSLSRPRSMSATRV